MKPTKPTSPTSRPNAVLAALALAAVVAGPLSACGSGSPAGVATPAQGRSGTTDAGAPTTPVGDPTSGVTGVTGGTTVTATSGPVTLEATLGVGYGSSPADPGVRRVPGLVVEYTVTNAGPNDLVAYDVVPKDLGSAALAPPLDAEHAWVVMSDGHVRLTKQGFDPAAGVRFMAAPVVGARALAAGGSVTGRAHATAPPTLTVPAPTFEAPRGAVDPAAERWDFCVQVVPRPVGARPSTADPNVLEVPTSRPVSGQLVCTEPVPLPTP